MFNFQSPLIRQFIQHVASKFQSATETKDYQNSLYPTSLYSTEHEDDEDYFRYAPSSIYSADSFCSKSTTITSTSTNTTTDSEFEKSYVSFPEFTPSTTSNRALFTMPEVMTATATPMFYTTPHSKPIWIA